MQQPKPAVATVASTLIIFLFVYTAGAKLLHIQTFQSTLSKSPWLHPFAGVLSVAIPFIELSIASLLIMPKTKYLGFSFSFILMTLFTAYILLMMAFASKLPCSCGGVLRSLTWKQHLLFNISFVLLSIAGIWSTKKPNDSAIRM